MFLELHLIQNFAPSNLNRDDTNAPKDCDFGGFRRARISSQCLKRALRDTFSQSLGDLIPSNNLAVRTNQLVNEVVKRLQEQGKLDEQSRAIVEMVLESVKLKVKEGSKTAYLLFLGKEEINKLVALCEEHWETLVKLIPDSANKPDAGAKKDKAKGKDKEAKEALPKEISSAMSNLMDGGKAVDLALFGRMLADLPEKNIDAACQMAHAISTNKVSTEFDFFTAIDDLANPHDQQGAGMLGTVEFNSACFYRYSNVDLKQLKHNLDDEELTLKAAQAFVQASVKAIPTGKQNSMAAQNPPSFVMVVLRKSGLWSLANAFLQPVCVKQDPHSDLVGESTKALTKYWDKLVNTYGEDEIIGKWFISLESDQLPNSPLSDAQVDNLAILVKNLMEKLKDSNGGH
ncbi:MAG: CRISPR-associated protein [bacterium]|nr:MAG: CRISPR-associated protein [bacterium]